MASRLRDSSEFKGGDFVVEILSDYELDKMRAAGKLVAEILKELKKEAKPGVSTKYLDDVAQRIIKEAGGSAPCIGYGNPPFPAAICTSINDEVVHGIPSKHIKLHEGGLFLTNMDHIQNSLLFQNLYNHLKLEF